MSKTRYRLNRFLVLASLLIVAFGASRLTFGQENRFVEMGAVSNFRAANPKESNRPVSPRPGKPTAKDTKSSPEERKRQEVDQAIKEGNAARDGNNYEQALNHYRRAEALNPKDARAHYGLGNLYADFLCTDASIDYYLRSLKFDPDYSDARVGLGYSFAKEEQYAKAEEQFAQVLNRQANHVAARIGLGLVYAKRGKYEEAIAEISRVIETGSTEDQAKAYFARGDVYFDEEKNWKKAVTEYEMAIKVKPDFASAFVKLAFAQLWRSTSKLDFGRIRGGDSEEADKLRVAAKQATDNINTAIRLKYIPPGVYGDLAIAFAYQRRYQEAFDNVKLFSDKVSELRKQMPSLASGCTAGFNRINAEANVVLGRVSEIKGTFEADDMSRGKLFEDAIKSYEAAVKLKEDYAGGYSALGSIYLEMNKFEDALHNYKQALIFTSSRSHKAGIYAVISRAHSRLGHHNEAIEQAQEAIRLNPNTPALYEVLASAYVGAGNLEETFQQLKRASELRTKLGLEDSADAAPYHYLGVTYAIRFMKGRDEKDFDEALKLLKRAVELRPKNASYYQALGIVYQTHSDVNESLNSYEKAISLDPKDPMNYLNVGRIYSELKRNDEVALERFKRAIETKPDFAVAHWHLGQLYQRRKDDAEAVKSFQDAIKYDPKFVQSYRDLASIYRAQKNYDAAIKSLATAIGIAPQNAELYQQLGLAYLARSNIEEALTNFNRAIEYDQKNSDNYFYLARVHSELRHDDEAALKQLLEGIERNPKDPDLDVAIAEIHRRRKNYPEAIKYFESAIQKAPKVPWRYKDLAKVYEAQGDNGNAIRYYDEALKRLDPNDSTTPSTKELYLGRKARLMGKYVEAIEHFRKVSYPDEPGQSYYEIGVVNVVSKKKKAALAQYEQLKQMKSSLAEELLRQINDMK